MREEVAAAARGEALEARGPGAGRAARARCAAGCGAAECPKTTLDDVEDEVMCPVCGTPLGSRDRGAAGEARARADPRGWSTTASRKEQIKAAPGGRVRRRACWPSRATTGSTWPPTWCPALAVLLGGGVVAGRRCGWRRRAATAAAGDRGRPARRPAPSAERLRRDLDRYEL